MIKKIIIGVLFIVAAAALGRGVWAMQAVQTEERAKSALGDAIKNAASLQSFSFTATTTGKVVMKSVEVPSSLDSIKNLPTSFTFNVFSKGDMDLRSRENPSAEMSFDAAVETEKTATTSASLSLAAQQILFEKNNYLNFSKFEIALTSTDPKLSGVQVIIGMINGFTSSVKNKWIKADSLATASSTTGGVPAIIGDKKIADYMSGLSYIKSTTFVGKEQIAGNPTYHLSLVLQYEKELFDILRQAAMENGVVPPKQVEVFNKNLDSLEKSFVEKSFTVNVWVGENDPFIYRILIQDFTFEDTVNKINLTLTQDTTVYNQNKAFSINAPQEALTLQEIIKNIFGASLNSTSATVATKNQRTMVNSRANSDDTAIKNNFSEMLKAAKLYYEHNGSSYGSQGNCEVSSTGGLLPISGSCDANLAIDTNFWKSMKTAVVVSAQHGFVNVSQGGQAWAALVVSKADLTKLICTDSTGYLSAVSKGHSVISTSCRP